MITLQFSGNATTGQVREITHGGKRYLISPVVALREGILNDTYVSAAEFGKFASSWQGRPVPISHPKSEGIPTSANTPDIWANDVLGHLWNVAVDGGALKGEIWIDLDKAQLMGQRATTIINRLRQGDAMEVSTGYFCEMEVAPGQWGGKSYTGVARNIRPDHLALLPDETGACSWADGCGTPRINTDQGTTMDEHTLFQRFLSWLKNDQLPIQSPAVNAEDIVSSPVNSCEPSEGQIVVEANISTEGGSMNKTELIGALVANAKCKFSQEKLAAWDEADLTVLQESLEATADKGLETASPEAEVSGQQSAVLSPQSDLSARIAALEDMIKGLTANVNASANEERAGLVASIVANCRGAWQEAELARFDTNKLRSVYASYQPRDYSANAGTWRQSGSEDEELMMHWPMFEQKEH